MRPGRRPCVLSRPRDAAVLVVVLVATVLVFALAQAVVPPVRLHAQQLVPAVLNSPDVHPILGRYAVMPAPQSAAPAFMSTPQPLTAAQTEMGLLDYDRLSPTWAGRHAAAITASVAGAPGAGTEVVPRDDRSPSATPDGDPAGRLLHRLIQLTPSAFGLAVRMVAEPSVAVGDSVIWVTGNWFAARSGDDGATWTYVNPYVDFPTFASDQDTAYDGPRHAFLWYRQGGLLPGRLENSFRLSVSTDGAASWCSFGLRPSDVDSSWTTLNFDYPHLALSDNYLYISSMLVVTGAGFATPRMVLLRLPLDSLASCSAFRYVYWTSDEGWSWTPVENGATTTMYLGDTVDAGGAEHPGTFRLYAQPESTTTLSYVDRSVPAWTFTERNGLCSVLGGGNPCARTDQRVTTGWVRQRAGGGEIGFLWNVREGGGFPQPYIDAVTFDEESLSVTGRPMLWDSKCAWQYGATAPSGPDLAVAGFYFCASQAPAHAIGLADRRTGSHAGR